MKDVNREPLKKQEPKYDEYHEWLVKEANQYLNFMDGE